MLLEMKCLVLIMYYTTPKQTHILPPLCVREAKFLGLESKPTHGLTEKGNTAKKRWMNPCPSPWSCSSSADSRGLPCASFAVHWAGIPAAVKMLFLCWEKKPSIPLSQEAISLPVFGIIIQWVRALTLEKMFFSGFSSAQQNPTHIFQHSEECNLSYQLWWIVFSNVYEFTVRE